MEITKAFEILNLDFACTEKDIIRSFKSLAKKEHPDLGGSKEKMAELNTAKEIAKGYISNRSLIVSISNEITTRNLAELNEKRILEKKYTRTINKVERRTINKIKIWKNNSAFLGIFSAVTTFLTSSGQFSDMLSVFGKFDTAIFLPITAMFGLLYFFTNNKANNLQSFFDDFKNELDSREYFHQIFNDIFRNDTKRKQGFTRQYVSNLINRWLGKRRKNPIFALIIRNRYYDESREIQQAKQMCDLIGFDEFSKLLIIKAEEFDYLESFKPKGS